MRSKETIDKTSGDFENADGYGDHESDEREILPGDPLILQETPRRRGRPPKGDRIGDSSASSSRHSSRTSTPPPLEIPKPDGTEKGQFLHDLYSFMQRVGQPITKVPHLGYQELDLHKLYRLVIARGGMDEVTRRQEWKIVYQELGIPTMSTSASYNTRTNYKKHLYLYELEHCDFNERRPPGMEPKFRIEEHVRIVSSNYDGQVFYAKVVKCRWKQSKNMYYVHYNGWSNSHDEWMPEGVLSKLLAEETKNPEHLVNPHPNRSSKSNRIIGEPPQPLESRPGRDGQKLFQSDSEELENYVQNKSSSDKVKNRSLRLRLRHRDRSDEKILTPGPNAETIQLELDKLEAEKFLNYDPPTKLKLLTVNNIHHYNEFKTAGIFKKELLKTVNLRVPNIDELVGQPPLSKFVDLATESGVQESSSRTKHHESIIALEKELRSIGKEYRKKKKLVNLYYGTSESSSEISGSNEGLTNIRSERSLATSRRTSVVKLKIQSCNLPRRIEVKTTGVRTLETNRTLDFSELEELDEDIFDRAHFQVHPWDRVSIANWIKYPNDLTPHVVHVDYLSRTIDHSTGILHTERLLTCRQNVPAFISKIFGGEDLSLFYEKSEVDRLGRTLTLRSRNLTFCNLLVVEEICRYAHAEDENTILRQEASIRSFTGWSHIANAIEDFVVKRFHANAQKGRQALEHAIDRIYQETKEQVLETLQFFEHKSNEKSIESNTVTTSVDTTV